MATILLSPVNVVTFPEGGGHLWVYLQYAHALRSLGCDVVWLEGITNHELARARDRGLDLGRLASLLARRLRPYGVTRTLFFVLDADRGGERAPRRFLGTSRREAEKTIREADLLLNFNYTLPTELVAGVRRSALVDIDPGLFQYWMSAGLIRVAPHDVYFTTGETVGTARATFPDCGLRWHRIRPSVCLDLWPFRAPPRGGRFTTISSWWSGEWVEQDGVVYDNNKRATFLEYGDLPRLSGRSLEIALCLGPDEAGERRMMRSLGWRIVDPGRVAGTPEAYRRYIQASRGEFSIAKPSCMRFRNAWVSDRTLCYLASGRPAVVQHTGPSRLLPTGEGVFRFSSPEEAAAALECVDRDYRRQCEAARALAEERFDARRTAVRLLDKALSRQAPARAPIHGRSANEHRRTPAATSAARTAGSHRVASSTDRSP